MSRLQSVSNRKNWAILGISLLIAIAIPVVGLSLSTSTAFASQSLQPANPGVVSGTITEHNGRPLRGVEVFLGVGEFPPEPRYTCTDSNGNYMFTDVPLDTELRAITGLEVNLDERCSNPTFLGRERWPLLTNYYEGHSGYPVELDLFEVTEEEPVFDADFEVERWPTQGFRMLNPPIRRAARAFHRCNESGVTRWMGVLTRLVDRLEARGRMDSAQADELRLQADGFVAAHIDFIDHCD